MADFVSRCVVVPVVMCLGLGFSNPKSGVTLTEEFNCVIECDRYVFVIASKIR